MKILFPIGTLYPSQQGGPSNTVYWMAKALVKNGVQVTLVTTDLGAEGKIESNRWLSTPYGRVIYYARQNAQFPVRLIATATHLIKVHDCIHLNSLFYPPSFLLSAVAIWRKKTVIWSCRGNLHPQALMYGRWKKRPILWLIKKFLSGKRVFFHATSNEESEQIRHMFGSSVRIVQIPNYLEMPDVLPRNKESLPFFLYVGRLHAIKALDHLISAFALSQSFMKSRFIFKIAGEAHTSYAQLLREQIMRLHLQEKVQFIGLVEGEAKQQLYADAYFTILPSHSENFGNVVVESLAQGTPVIATLGTPWAILTQELAGFWVENSPPALAAVIEESLDIPQKEYEAYRNRSLSLARQRFDISENIRFWIDVYKQSVRQYQ